LDEKVYEEALCHEMRIRGIPYERQRNFELLYKGYKIGQGTADFIINPFWATKKEENVLEIKSVKKIEKKHIKQAKVYMNSLGINKGAVIGIHYKVGVQVEPLELSTVKGERLVQEFIRY
ncbi:MAG: GxxExxY protein, partial [candidate division WOR-3 bacterium]